MKTGYLIFGLMIVVLASQAALAFVDEPAGCWQEKQTPCAIKTAQYPEQFVWQGQQIFVASQTSCEFSVQGVRLLEGFLWFQSDAPLKIFTSYVQLESRGELWLHHTPDKTEVKNLNADIKGIELQPGFENWYSGLDSKGQRRNGVIRPIQISKFLPVWVFKMRVSRNEASDKLRGWHEAWKATVDKSAEIYKEAIRREIASQEEKARIHAQKRRSAEEERELLRRLYRSKNGFPEKGP